MVLNRNQRLVYAGDIKLRAPNGTELPAVSQYMIVAADIIENEDPSIMVKLPKGEQLVLAGRTFNDKQTAEERFDAVKAGKPPPPQGSGEPLYIKEDKRKINPETGLSKGEERACSPLINDLYETFTAPLRPPKALKEQETQK